MGAPKAAAWSYDHRPNIHLTVAIQTQECLGTRAEVNCQNMKTCGSCVHTLFSLLLRARRCFQGGPVRPSPSQPTLSSFSEGVGLGITHDIKPITCHRKELHPEQSFSRANFDFVLRFCNVFCRHSTTQRCLINRCTSESFPPRMSLTRKRKAQEGASGTKSTTLSLCWIQRCYSTPSICHYCR